MTMDMTMGRKVRTMKTVSKAELKSRMLEYLREVEETGEELVVTHNRIPVARISPIRRVQTVDEVFGPFRFRFRSEGDLTDPTSDAWPQLD